MTVCLTMLNKCNRCLINHNQSKYNFLNSNQRVFSVVLLDESKLDICIDVKSTIGDLFQQVCDKLKLKEYDIFGLAHKIKNEYHFVSNDEKINKYVNSAKRGFNFTASSLSVNMMNQNVLYNTSSSMMTTAGTARSTLLPSNSLIGKFVNHLTMNSSSSSQSSIETVSYVSPTVSVSNKSLLFKQPKAQTECNCGESSTLTVYFLVKFYVNDPLLLRDPQARHLYYLQLKQNYLHLNHKMNDERYFVLASLALIVDYGRFSASTHTGKYFKIENYFPKWIIGKLGESYIFENTVRLHEQQSGCFTIVNAQNRFCIELSDDEYPFNFHIYNVYKNKEETPGSICLGIAPKGILVFEMRPMDEISLISTFNWSSVTKLNADKKKFEIIIDLDSNVRKYAYYTNSEKFTKYLLELSKITHAFTTNIFARLANQKTLAYYVNESYSEKVLAYSETQEEHFEEREIIAELRKSNPQLSSTNLLSGTSNLISASSSSSASSHTNSNRSSQISTSLKSVDQRQITIANDKQPRNDQQTSSKTKHQPLSFSSVSSSSSSSYDTASRENGVLQVKKRTSSFRNSDSFNDYYEYNKNLLLSESSAETSNHNDDDEAEEEEPEEVRKQTVPQTVNTVSIQSNRCKSFEDLLLKSSNKNSELNNSMPNMTGRVKTVPLPLPSGPPPPLPSSHAPGTSGTTTKMFYSPMTSNSRRNDYLNDSSLDDVYNLINQSDDHHLTHSISINSDRQRYQLNKVPDGDRSAAKTQLSTSFDAIVDSNYLNSYCLQPQTKVKKPPSYEESIRKLKKYSIYSSSASSSSSSTYSDAEQSNLSSNMKQKPTTTTRERQVVSNSEDDDNLANSLLQEESLYETLNDDESQQHQLTRQDSSSNNIKGINLSIENLEQIRAKAASLSLPLLTALCSDQTLIQSIVNNHNKQTS